VIALVLLAAVVRVYWASQPRLAWGDEPFYLWVGQSLWDGHGYGFFGFSGAHFAPLYPLLAGLLARPLAAAGWDVPAALKLGSEVIYVAAGTLTVLPIYGLARRLTGVRGALAAGLVVAVSPPLAVGALLWGTMTEPLFLLWIVVAWWGLLVALQDGRHWAYLLAGAGLALAYLVRTEALVYLVAGLATVFLLQLGRPLVKTLAGLGLTLAAFALLISPYLVAQYLQTGRLQLTEESGFAYTSMQGLVKGDTAVFDRATWGLDPASGEVYLFAPASEDADLIGAIVADPRTFARLLSINVGELFAKGFSARLIPWPLAALAVLGLFRRSWDGKRTRSELMLAASLAGPLSFVLFFIQERYLAGALIAAAVWVGAGAVALGDWLEETIAEGTQSGQKADGGRQTADGRTPAPERIGRDAAFGIVSLVPTACLAVVLLWQGPRLWADMQQTHSFQPGHGVAAAKLQELGAPSDAVVMSRYPAIAFHAGTRWAPTPAATWLEVAAYARAHGVRFLVMDEWEAQLRPQLGVLLDPATAPPELRHLATVDAGAGSVLLYELDGGRP
jgi:hypothetical protein